MADKNKIILNLRFIKNMLNKKNEKIFCHINET